MVVWFIKSDSKPTEKGINSDEGKEKGTGNSLDISSKSKFHSRAYGTQSPPGFSR